MVRFFNELGKSRQRPLAKFSTENQKPESQKALTKKFKGIYIMKKIFSKKDYILIASSWICFGIVTYLMMTGKLEGFDHAVQNFFFSFRSDALTKIIAPFSYSGNWPLPTAICALLLAFKKTRTTYGVPMSISALSCVGIYQALKYTFQRPRPDVSLHLVVQSGYSFPSGHSLTSLVTWTMLIWLLLYYYKNNGKSLPLYQKHPQDCELYPKKKSTMILWMVFLILYIVCMGLSRIYVGVHWPSDVLGSWILGVSVLVILRGVFFNER